MINLEIKKVLFITYFFLENDGVGAQRSRSLYYFLQKKGIQVDVVSKQKNPLILICKLIYSLIFKSYDKVYVSCGPFNYLLLVSLLCLFSRKKLIIDFRDAWSINIFSNYGKGGVNKGWKYFVSLFIEKFSYFSCDKFVVCTLGMYEKYATLFGDDKKICLIENGYDFNSYEKRDVNENNNLSLVCIGKFAEYDFDKARLTIEFIKEVCQYKRRVTINFVGSNKKENEKLMNELNTGFIVNFYPRMSYSNAVEIAQKCDVGLLVIRDEDIDYGTKFFDYVGLGLPFYAYLDQNKNFYKVFNKFLYDFNKNSSTFNQSDIQEYSRKNQFEKFKGILFS